MKSKLLITCFLLSAWQGYSQSDSLLTLLQDSIAQPQQLLPSKMLFTQRMLWGHHGLVRQLGWAPLTMEHRQKELKLRRTMLVTHQALGFATLAGFVAQGVVGAKLYNGSRDLKDAHESLAATVNLTYSLTGLMALAAPPPMLNRDKKVSSIRLHKWLAAVHITGMLVTNVLAGQIESNPQLKKYHRAAAFTTFASFAAAMLVIKI